MTVLLFAICGLLLTFALTMVCGGIVIVALGQSGMLGMGLAMLGLGR